MSTRRKPGDIVYKKAFSGLSGDGGVCVIPAGSVPDVCPLGCGDPDCNEWPDLWPVDASGAPKDGNWYHVSECELEDAQ